MSFLATVNLFVSLSETESTGACISLQEVLSTREAILTHKGAIGTYLIF